MRESDEGLRFDTLVPSDGYAWWYVDALSDDGRHAITLIAFIGSVFSPYYAWARRRGTPIDARNHCALNISLRGPGGARWAMTERGAGALRQQTSGLGIGPSSLRWDGDALLFDLDEITAPLPSRIRGQVRLIPQALAECAFHLDAASSHRWTPIAPSAHVEVNLRSPDLRWSGTGYFDSNQGSEPLETHLERWSWSRGNLRDGGTAILYDVIDRDGGETALALSFDRHARMRAFEPPPRASLGRSGWRIARATRSDDGIARVERSLQDAPFYARAVVRARLLGEPVTSVHETLDLARFRSPVVQAMLTFRMPRSNRR